MAVIGGVVERDIGGVADPEALEFPIGVVVEGAVVVEVDQHARVPGDRVAKLIDAAKRSGDRVDQVGGNQRRVIGIGVVAKHRREAGDAGILADRAGVVHGVRCRVGRQDGDADLAGVLATVTVADRVLDGVDAEEAGGGRVLDGAIRVQGGGAALQSGDRQAIAGRGIAVGGSRGIVDQVLQGDDREDIRRRPYIDVGVAGQSVNGDRRIHTLLEGAGVVVGDGSVVDAGDRHSDHGVIVILTVIGGVGELLIDGGTCGEGVEAVGQVGISSIVRR